MSSDSRSGPAPQPPVAYPVDPPITADLAQEHGLTPAEYRRVLSILGRTPSYAELGVFAAMWSEHCSYKSTKRWLKTLPTTAPWVIHGPGENAGVIDIGDGLAAVFKIESHNHPSFIEPYQGAATGVGGILRDVFTMGARPVANLNSLSFGAPDHPRTRHLLAGAVAGIGGYGNCVGVPTVGGETRFHAAYNGNILVNAMTVGIAPRDRIFLSAAAGVGNPVVYVGSKTGRDGIRGATMASASFSAATEEMRPTVQVGDPFTEKLLIEACLELMATDAILAIQDMGAAGLTSSAVEMAGKGGCGIDLDLDQVPQREASMTAYDMMLSESQERMLMVLRPGAEDQAAQVFAKWALDFAIIGRVSDTGRLVVRHQGAVRADLVVAPLVDAAPEYDRPWVAPVKPAVLAPTALPLPEHAGAVLLRLIGCPDLASKAWIWQQYDSQVMADTVAGPGQADAAIVRVHGTNKALAMTADVTPRYVIADPETGGAQAVVEAWRNLCAVGARPLAVTDNLNFGDPQRPAIMGQLVAAVKGMGAACRALDMPIVSGNVSLYNETKDERTGNMAIQPTPTIGAVGLIEDLGSAEAPRFATIGGSPPRAASTGKDGLTIMLIGNPGTGHLGASLYAREIHGREEGAPPPVDLAAERRTGELVRALIGEGLVAACHDIADGGLLVALAEMALAADAGLLLEPVPSDATAAGWWFGEDQGRYLAATRDPTAVLAHAATVGVPVQTVAHSHTAADAAPNPALTWPDGYAISLARLREQHEGWLPTLMGDTAPGT